VKKKKRGVKTLWGRPQGIDYKYRWLRAMVKRTNRRLQRKFRRPPTNSKLGQKLGKRGLGRPGLAERYTRKAFVALHPRSS